MRACGGPGPGAGRRGPAPPIPYNRAEPSGCLDGAADDVAVIDTGNCYPQQRDGKITEIEEGLTESRWTESRIGHPVIKAFNGTYAQDIIDLSRQACAHSAS